MPEDSSIPVSYTHLDVYKRQGINLKIEQGEFVFIVGDSGSGKSTLIRLIMKELDPTSGTIIVNGHNLNRMKHKKIPLYRRKLGVVFQDFRLLKDRNIYENIAFAQRVTETSTRIIKKKVQMCIRDRYKGKREIDHHRNDV